MTALESPPTLICGAMPLGYGPAAKLLVIARALRGRGLRLVLTGRGIALELAARSPSSFDEVVPDGPAGVPEALLGEAAGVLSVMDRELARAASLSGLPLYVVDSLLWMRDIVPPEFRAAHRYWAQDFIGLRKIQSSYLPVPSLVGPILASQGFPRQRSAAHLLINLGGCESSQSVDPNAHAYADFVVSAFLKSPLAAFFAGRTTVMAGVRCIEALHTRYASGDLEIVSLAHEDAMQRLARAALVLTSPGLTMTLESFQAGIPAYFLPPQSYSQWCALRLLRAAGLAPHALHWEDLSPHLGIRDRAAESERNPLVRAAVGRFVTDDRARARLGDCLAEIACSDHASLAAAQGQFFSSLGPNGARSVAEEIASDILSGRRRDPPGRVPLELRLDPAAD